VDGRADEVIAEEVLDDLRGLGAENAVGLEEEDARGGPDLLLEPGTGEEGGDGGAG
jgi:hypothetical protein